MVATGVASTGVVIGQGAHSINKICPESKVEVRRLGVGGSSGEFVGAVHC